MKKTGTKFAFFFLAICLLWIPDARADTHTSASCSYSDVNAAVRAASNGDTVAIPAGTCSWGSRTLFGGGKRITIQGAGSSSTIINSNGNTISFSNTNNWRVTGIRINVSTNQAYAIMIAEGGTGWRIDHNYIACTGTTYIDGVLARGNRTVHPYGVVDNNTFVNARVLSYWDANCDYYIDYTEPLGLGGPNAVYVEDNTFNKSVGPNIMDGNCGTRWVFRHNTVTDTTADGYQLETHSVQGPLRGTRWFEVYGNTFNENPTNNNTESISYLRGGTGVIFDNTVNYSYTWSWGQAFTLNNYGSSPNRVGKN
jgi:hypothetical protein